MPLMSSELLVFLDESYVHTALSRDYARSKQRVYEARRIRPKTQEKFTLLAGLSSQGIVAAWELQGSLTGDAFVVYVKEI